MRKKNFLEIIKQEQPDNLTKKEIQKYGIFNTSKGMVKFYKLKKKDELDELDIDEGLRNFRKPQQQLEALKEISELPEGSVFVACHGKTIIGYLAFHKPEFPRWAKAAESELVELIELGGIEVSTAWRGEGIGKNLLRWTVDNFDFESNIMISIETCYNWKSRDPSISIWEYREMIKNVLSHIGLKPKSTDDPEILEHPANMLTARIGKNVNPKAREKFEKLLKVSRFEQEFH